MTTCEEYGHDYYIVDASGDVERYRCADCGVEYDD